MRRFEALNSPRRRYLDPFLSSPRGGNRFPRKFHDPRLANSPYLDDPYSIASIRQRHEPPLFARLPPLGRVPSPKRVLRQLDDVDRVVSMYTSYFDDKRSPVERIGIMDAGSGRTRCNESYRDRSELAQLAQRAFDGKIRAKYAQRERNSPYLEDLWLSRQLAAVRTDIQMKLSVAEDRKRRGEMIREHKEAVEIEDERKLEMDDLIFDRPGSCYRIIPSYDRYHNNVRK